MTGKLMAERGDIQGVNKLGGSGEQASATRVTFAFTVLVLYFIFEYIKPQSGAILPLLGPLRIPMILVFILLALFLKSDKQILEDKLVRYVMFFVLLVGFSVTYAVNTFHVWQAFKLLLIIFLCAIVMMPVICNNTWLLRRFVSAWILINVLLAVFGLIHGGHGPGGWLWDENDLALALNMAVPVPAYLMLSKQNTVVKKIFLLIATIIIIVGAGSTMSRGGFLGLISIFFVFLLFSERKAKTLSVFILCIAVAGYPVYKLIPDKYKEEMSSISDTEDDTRQDRFEFWGYGWGMFLENPLLGVGAKNFPWTVPFYQMKQADFDPDKATLYGGRPAHSLYFTLIPELGLAGIIIYALIVVEIFRRMRFVKKTGAEHEELEVHALIAKALMASTVAFLVTGAFISVLYYPPFWYLVAFVITLERVTRAELEVLRIPDDQPA
jgi:probable O-glycosylation ligase (exosortase A-associated)